MSVSIVTSSGTLTDAPGACQSSHLFYATNTALWWYLYYTSASATTLSVKYSSDLVTWSTPTNPTFTLAHANGGSGSAFGIDYASIGGHDVVHLNINAVVAGTAYVTHLRATLAGTTVTWGTEVQTLSTTWGTTILRGATAIGADGSIVDQGAAAFLGNVAASKSSNLDTGTAWTTGFAAGVNLLSTATITISYAIMPLTGSTGYLLLGDNGAAAGAPTNIVWSLWKPSAWAPVPATTVFATNLSIGANDWGACLRTDTDAHCVRYEGGGVYTHRRWNGTSWSAGNGVQSLTSNVGGGVALASDGISVWLFVISSDAASSVQTNKWTVAGGWGGWSIVEGSAQGRRALTAGFGGPTKQIALSWSQQNGANFDIAVESIATSLTVGTAVAAGTGSATATAFMPFPAVQAGAILAQGALTNSSTQVARLPFSPSPVATGTAATAASGLACQTHTIYAVNGKRWWQFWFDIGQSSNVRCAWSTDLLLWTVATSGQLTLPHAGEGRNLCVAYTNAGGTDVVHVSTDHLVTTTGENYFLRATLAGPLITWGADTPLAIGAVNAPPYYTYTGVATALSSTGLVYVSSGYLANNCDVGNIIAGSNVTADTGAAWSPGAWLDSAGVALPTTGTPNSIEVLTGYGTSNALIPLAAGQMLLLGQDDPSATGLEGGNLYATTGAAGVWGTPVGLLGTELSGAYLGAADWGWAARTTLSSAGTQGGAGMQGGLMQGGAGGTTDVHVVIRLPATNSFSHFRFTGTDWLGGDAVPDHTSIGGAGSDTGGVALTTDGTFVWAFLVDSVAGNAIYACQWTMNTGWGTWTLVTRTAATRSFLCAAHTMVNGTTALSWTEGASSPYTLMTLAFPVSGSTLAQAMASGSGLADAEGAPLPVVISGAVVSMGAGTPRATGILAIPGLAQASGSGAAAASVTVKSVITTGNALTGGTGGSGVSGTFTPALVLGAAAAAGTGATGASGSTSAVIISGTAATAGAGNVVATGITLQPVVSGNALAAGAGTLTVSSTVLPAVQQGAALSTGTGTLTPGGAVLPAVQQGAAFAVGSGASAVSGAFMVPVFTGTVLSSGAGQVSGTPAMAPAIQPGAASVMGGGTIVTTATSSQPGVLQGNAAVMGAAASSALGTPHAGITTGGALSSGTGSLAVSSTVTPATLLGGAQTSGAGLSAAQGAMTPGTVAGTALVQGAGTAVATGTPFISVQQGTAITTGAGASMVVPLGLLFGTAGSAGAGAVGTQAFAGASGVVGGFALVTGAGTAAATGTVLAAILTGAGAASGGGSLTAAGSALPASVAGGAGALGAGAVIVSGDATMRMAQATSLGAAALDIEGSTAPAIMAGVTLTAGMGASTAIGSFVAAALGGTALAAGGGGALATGQFFSATASSSAAAAGGGTSVARGIVSPAILVASTGPGGAGSVSDTGSAAPAVQQGAALSSGAGASAASTVIASGVTPALAASSGAGTVLLAGSVAPAAAQGSVADLGAGSVLASGDVAGAILSTNATVLGAGGVSLVGGLASAVQAGSALAAGNGAASASGLIASAITPSLAGASGGGASQVTGDLVSPVQVASAVTLGSGAVNAPGANLPVLVFGSILTAGAGQVTDPHQIVLIALPPILGTADYQVAQLTCGDYQPLVELLRN